MTENMKRALRQLFAEPGGSGYVTMKTAFALSRKGFVVLAQYGSIPARQRTAALQFPEFWVTLTATGRTWCLDHAAPTYNI